MSSIPTTVAASEADDSIGLSPPPQELRFRVWPFRHERGATVAMLAWIGSLAALGWCLHGGLWLPLIVAAASVVVHAPLFVPVEIELTTQHISCRRLRRTVRLGWQGVRRAELYHSGALLLMSADPAAVAYLAGIYLPWGDRAEDVTAWLQYGLPREHIVDRR